MDRRRKVELFEQIRREYTHGVGTIQGTARKLGVHRHMVRQAVALFPPSHQQIHSPTTGWRTTARRATTIAAMFSVCRIT